MNQYQRTWADLNRPFEKEMRFFRQCFEEQKELRKMKAYVHSKAPSIRRFRRLEAIVACLLVLDLGLLGFILLS